MAHADEPNRSLSPGEKAQLALGPAKDAVFTYLDAHTEANARTQEVGIDIDKVAISISWVGGVLDDVTAQAFAAIQRSTGIPMVIVPVKFSGADIEATGARILAENPDARTVGHDLDTLVVRVVDGSAARPATITVAGEEMPIRYEKSDGRPSRLRPSR